MKKSIVIFFEQKIKQQQHQLSNLFWIIYEIGLEEQADNAKYRILTKP